MTHSMIPLAVIVFAGALAALQAPMNAALGESLGSGTVAATISFGVGFGALLLFVATSGDLSRFAQVPTVNRWLLMGGFLGAFYVWAILWTIPVLGVVTAISGMILGQLLAALLLDSYGPFGLPIKDISPERLLGVAFVAAGLALSKL